MAYLDHAAATPVLTAVLDEVQRVAASLHANPSGSHAPARAARARLEDARDEIAGYLGVGPHEVVFTSGGTESDNLALRGAPAGPRVVSAVEHKAVLTAAPGARVVPVDGDGVIDLDHLEHMLDAGVSIVSVMTGNNEVGSLQPVDAVAEAARRLAPGALVHTDAVQSVGYVALPAADLVTLSAHKLGGPRGIGALVVRGSGAPLTPLMTGGGQEEGRRPGTEDVAGAAGFAVALRHAVKERPADACRLHGLGERLATGVSRVARRNGPRDTSGRLPHICHVTIEGCRAEDLLVLLDRAGVAASAGSACASGAVEPSHVLRAMAMTPDEARSSLRFSFGPDTTEDDIDAAVIAVLHAVRDLACA